MRTARWAPPRGRRGAGVGALARFAVALLAVGGALAGGTPAARAASPSVLNASNASIPLLLVHGFNDDCQTAFDTPGLLSDKKTLRPPPNDTARGYLGSYFGRMIKVGYYTNPADSTNTGDSTGVCDENLNNDPSLPLTECDAISTDGLQYGTKDDHLDRLSCLLAWYVFDNFTQYGQPVNVLAHSMGGLLIRYALGAVAARAAHFPPVLWVNNVVTVATPHGGIYGWFYTFASSDPNLNGVELDMMNPGAAFMQTIAGYQAPQGYDGTRWTLIGAFDAEYITTPVGVPPPDGGNFISYVAGANSDGVVPSDSQFAMVADYKVAYGVQGGLPFPNAADWYTQYEHETGIGCPSAGPFQACFNGPYYLNDSSTALTEAWTCTGCSGDPGGSPISVSHSLAMIAGQLQQKAVPTLPSFDLVLRSNANLDYVSAELGYTGGSYAMLRARATTKGPWESWTRVLLPTGHWLIRSNANGKFVSAELGYTGADQDELRARTDASAIGPWEVFDIVSNPDGTYALRSLADGRYASAELGYTGASYGELRARAASIGPWETYTSSTTSPSCTDYGNTSITGPNSCAGTFSTHSTWFSGSGVGLHGQELWTYANGTVQDSTATYRLSGLDTVHVMQIQAYIPNCCSDASHAHYHFCSPGGGCGDAYVNQNDYTNQWAVAGAVCTSDGTATITLADDGGDVYPAVVGADAITAVALQRFC